MSITTTLPLDTQNRRYLGVGPDGLLPDGVTTVGGRRATLYTLLVAADGTTPLLVASSADAVSNTQSQVPTAARLQGYNGTTWDRLRSDTTNGLDVDVTRLPALVASSAVVGKVGIDQTTPGTTDSVSVKKTALTASAPGAATVGTGSAVAVAANANRKGLVLVNTSTNTISLAFGAAAVLNSGITLSAGASYSMGAFDFTTAEVRAIASAASSNLAYQEFV
jgi:hypothetical protein